MTFYQDKINARTTLEFGNEHGKTMYNIAVNQKSNYFGYPHFKHLISISYNSSRVEMLDEGNVG